MWSNDDLLAAHQASALPGSLPVIWAVKGALRAQLAESPPNPAHHALVKLEKFMAAKGAELTIATQNIDGLHQAAGSERVYELHGSVRRSRCADTACPRGPFPDETVPALGELPRCPVCGHQPLRPDIVLFGEALPDEAWEEAEVAAQLAEVMLVVGTSGAVYPAMGLVDVASICGAYCVLVNAEPWDYPHPAFLETLIGPSEEILPDLAHAVT